MNSLRKQTKHLHDRGHGVQQDSRGQDQPTDKRRAQQASNREEITGEQAQRDAAAAQPQSPGQPAGGE
jgi:hypothetical protein